VSVVLQGAPFTLSDFVLFVFSVSVYMGQR